MIDDDITEQAATAQVYAKADLAVFPLWWATPDGRCACPRGQLHELDNNYCGLTNTGAVKGSPGKHPMTRNGVKAATTVLAQVNDWWTRAPLANIGLAAGANNLAVIDVDPHHGGDASLHRLATFATGRGVNLLNTMQARTGSGGLHLYYTAPQGVHSGKCVTDQAAGAETGCTGCIRNGQGNKPPFGADMPGLDTRGYGGYVVAPPSTHANGSIYEWIDFLTDAKPWPRLLSAIIEAAYKPATPTPVARPQRIGGDTGRYAEAALDREVQQLRGTAEGGRNAQLNVAAYNLGQLVGAGALDRGTVELELHGAAVSIGLTDAETRSTLRSGLTKGMAQPRTIRAASGDA